MLMRAHPALIRRPGSPVAEPPAILGIGSPGILGLRCWVRAANNVTESGGVISAVGAYGGTEVNLAQATAGKRPTLVTSTNGMLAVRFDGSNDTLEGSLLAGGSSARSYAWLVARATSLPGATTYFGIAYGGISGLLAPCRMTTTNFTGLVASTDGTDLVVGPSRDTNVHRFEVAHETSGTGRYRVDGVSYNGSFTGVPANTIATINLGSFQPPESNWGPVDVFEYGLATVVPTAAQRAQMAAYLTSRYGIA